MKFLDEKKVKYTEILGLYVFCREQGINAELVYLYDGFKIKFPDGSDVIQHSKSYGCLDGCVELAINCSSDYSAVGPWEAKALVIKYKDRLNAYE